MDSSSISIKSYFFIILDNRIIEYKFEEVLFSKQSDFQLVQVVDTKDYVSTKRINIPFTGLPITNSIKKTLIKNKM